MITILTCDCIEYLKSKPHWRKSSPRDIATPRCKSSHCVLNMVSFDVIVNCEFGLSLRVSIMLSGSYIETTNVPILAL